MSAALIWGTCAVIVASLALWLATVVVASRGAAFGEPRIEPRRDAAARRDRVDR